MLTIGTDPDSNDAALAAAAAHAEVFAAVGHHPNSADSFDDSAATRLRTLASRPGCRAIGETGLDYYRDRATPADQERTFAALTLTRQRLRRLAVRLAQANADEVTLIEAEAAMAEEGT